MEPKTDSTIHLRLNKFNYNNKLKYKWEKGNKLIMRNKKYRRNRNRNNNRLSKIWMIWPTSWEFKVSKWPIKVPVDILLVVHLLQKCLHVYFFLKKACSWILKNSKTKGQKGWCYLKDMLHLFFTVLGIRQEYLAKNSLILWGK